MSDLRQLYQEVILDHSSKPRNYRVLAQPCQQIDGVNPLCGDRVTVYLQVQQDVVQDVSFQGSGCAISKASASLMTESLKGKTVQQALQIFEQFHAMVTGQSSDAPTLEKLAVFAGVKDYPARVKCASLAWHTVKSALDGTSNKKVSTE